MFIFQKIFNSKKLVQKQIDFAGDEKADDWHEYEYELAKRWKNPNLMNFLINRMIKTDTKEKTRKITESRIIEEQWKFWMNSEANDPYNQVFMNPALSNSDYIKMCELQQKEEKKQIWTTFALTGCGLLIYGTFFSRNYIFYNFFKKPSKYKIIPFLKRSAGIIGLWGIIFGVVAYLTLKKIPYEIEHLGMLKKYNIYLNN